MDTAELATTYLEGIGPVSSRNLEDIGVFTVCDLVRASSGQIVAATGGRVSDATARRWRSMALLVEIDGVDNQLAEALVDADIGSTEQIRMRSASELFDLFSLARDAGTIPEVPELDRIHAILLDATHLYFTGSLMGTVRGPDGQGVADAAVSIGVQSISTDQRGRFRIVRIPLGFDHQLTISADGMAQLVVTDPPVTADDAVINVEVFDLAAASGASTGEPIILCEFEGDTLPEMTHHAMTTRAMGSMDSLREGDVLVLHRFYAGGDEAQLSSKFLQFSDGRFFTLNWRVPVVNLPQGAALKEVFRYRGDGFSRIRMSASQLQHYLALQRARKSLRGSAPPVTPMEIDVTIALFADTVRGQL